MPTIFSEYLKSIIFAGSDVKAKHLIEPKLLQREIPADVVDGNKVASCENQAGQKFLHKCERQDGQHINTIKPILEKTNAEVEEKSCEKINDENIQQYKQYLKYNFQELKNSDLEEIFSSKEILYLVRNINDLDYLERQALQELEAFEIFDYPIREYTYMNIASHIIGYIGKPTSEDFEEFPNTIKTGIVGKSGVEKYYENQLSGKAGEVVFKGDEIVDFILPEPGEDLYLTIDIETQIVATESLLEGIKLANENFESENIIQKGSVVVY